MQAIQLTIYKTDDGKTFESQTDAYVHQAALIAEPQARAFAETKTEDAKSQTRIVSTILDYVRWSTRSAEEARDTAEETYGLR